MDSASLSILGVTKMINDAVADLAIEKRAKPLGNTLQYLQYFVGVTAPPNLLQYR